MVDSEKLQLTEGLLQAVLAEAQVVCTGPLLIAGEIPCLAKGISADKFVDLALAYSLGEGRRLDATCKFRLEDCVGSRRDFIFGCSNALLHPLLAMSLIGGSLLNFSVSCCSGCLGCEKEGC